MNAPQPGDPILVRAFVPSNRGGRYELREATVNSVRYFPGVDRNLIEFTLHDAKNPSDELVAFEREGQYWARGWDTQAANALRTVWASMKPIDKITRPMRNKVYRVKR